MRKSSIFFAILVLVIAGSWWLAAEANSATASVFSGQPFTQLTGMLAIGLMAFATFLSARPAWLEPYMGGLDKMYRLHKWMSISGMAIGIFHWLTASGGGHGPGEGAGNTAAAATSTATTETLLESLRGPAHGVANPAMWIMLALVVVALIKKIPYDTFAVSHRLIPLPFLALEFHSIGLLNSAYWSKPAGWVMAVLFAIGTIGAVMSLLRLIGFSRKVSAKVVDKFYLPEKKTLRIGLQMDKGWKGHKPGQFAFLRGQSAWLAHPFTIASDWNPANPYLRVIVKELGDATTGINEKLPIGANIVIEGPYGRFNFESSKSRQIWISGGIGIAPFIARMKDLAETGNKMAVDLFHSDVVENSQAYDLMREDATAANVKLHLTIIPRDGLMTAERIRKEVPDWKNASIWFCGHSGFAAALKLDFVRNGLSLSDFHHELFEMR